MTFELLAIDLGKSSFHPSAQHCFRWRYYVAQGQQIEVGRNC
jgi:hypothetical protein